MASREDTPLMYHATSWKVAASTPDEINKSFSMYLILAVALGPGVHLASNRKKDQKQKNNVSRE
jgi:hypothetical protein